MSDPSANLPVPDAVISPEEAELRYILSRIDLLAARSEESCTFHRINALSFHQTGGFTWKQIAALRKRAHKLFNARRSTRIKH
jgi:hypothetical protein